MFTWKAQNGRTYAEAERGRFDVSLLRADYSEPGSVEFFRVAYTDSHYVCVDRTGFNECIDMEVVMDWADEYGLDLDYPTEGWK